MPALTFACKLMNLSFAYDAITVYPTFEYYEKPGLRNCLKVIETQCNKLEFVIETLPEEKTTAENDKFIKTLSTLQKAQNIYERYILRNDADHGIYHKDRYKLDDSHFHVKFNTILSRENIASVLDVFIENKMLTAEEKESFLVALDMRYVDSRDSLDVILEDNKDIDTDMILEYINIQTDIDLLTDLHSYLSLEKFDYLRVQSDADKQKQWQGTNREGKVVPTSEAWAMIEKLLSVKLAANISKDCSRFTPEVGIERAQQFAKALNFFAIKRKATANSQISKIYQSFANADAAGLEQKTNKILGRRPFKKE
jgi:hypothetical protein